MSGIKTDLRDLGKSFKKLTAQLKADKEEKIASITREWKWPSGHLVLSALVGGYLVHKTYIGYTEEEAVQDFYVNKMI